MSDDLSVTARASDDSGRAPEVDDRFGLAALDAVPAGITVQDARGRLVYGNLAAARLIGLPSVAAMLAATPGELMAAFEVLDEAGNPLPPSELPGRRVLEGRAGDGANERLLRFRVRGGAGGERWALVAARALRIGPQGPTFALNTFIDASDVARTQQHLRLALEAGSLGTWQWDIGADGSGGSVRWSAELERMHGLEPGTFAGTFEAYQQDMHPEDRPRILDEIRDNLARGTDHKLLYRIIRPDGAVRWVEARGRFELGPGGKPERLTGVCMDVTERTQMEEARAQLAAELAARRAAQEAAERTQEVLAAISDAFAVCSRDWVVVFANEESAKRLGMRPADVVGRSLWELAPGARGTPFEAALRRAMEERAVTRLEERIPPGDEWLEVIAYPLPDGGLAITSRDVTARKRDEEARARRAAADALRAELAGILAGGGELRAVLQQCCEAVIHHLPLALAEVWLLDPTGGWLDLEASAGARARPAGARRRARHGDPAHPGAYGEPVSDEAWARSVGLVAFTAHPLLAGDRMAGVLAAHAAAPLPPDIAAALERVGDAVSRWLERRRADIELQERARELARSNAELEQFAYVASHDLQEPLRIVASYTQLLARRYRGRLDQDADDFIDFSVDGINRMQRLIADLLAYSRVGSRAGEPGPVDVDRALSIALDNLAHAVTDAGARVTHGPLPTVVGDEGQLVQVLQNLVGNAVKFRGPAPPAVHVSARREAGGREWIFAVEDNGVGIEAQYFERIFVIFQRLHARDTHPGTGIGLALCKKIVERHGGRIWVESAPGAGSTFFFTLPVL